MTAGESNLQSAKSIYFAALDIEDSKQRSDYLDEACRGDDDLRREVDQLLSAVPAHSGNLLCQVVEKLNPQLENTPADFETPGDSTGQSIDVSSRPVIDRYKLLEEIGHGGMGSVYMAQQLKPIKRRVALKVINPGMDSREVIARFEAERQALAMMDHQNIAGVLDAGTTKDHRPYFVMELVRGKPITEYCQQNQLGLDDRLRLFIDVCQAIQHAHQKGIIHRDIKPSNVMVSNHDGTPVVKVIDFGIAKALHQDLTDKTLFTQFSQMVGTPLYMSPEQAGLSSLDVDTRSDIYSLGVLLYELLTGTTPFERETLAQAGIDGARKIICEQEPPRPSTRLDTLKAEALSTLATNQGVSVHELQTQLRGDLDWIVVQSLEKDRARRYQSAFEFAKDIERYLAGDPVEAHPPSWTYRTGKIIGRNKGVVFAATACLALLVCGIAGTMLGWSNAKKQEQLAVQRLTRAEDAEEKAHSEAKTAEAVASFLVDDLLAQAAPEHNPRAGGVTVEELLDRASANLKGKFDKQPTILARLHQTIGTTYGKLGELLAALEHLQKAAEILETISEPDPRVQLTLMQNLGGAYLEVGKLKEGDAILEEQLILSRKVFGNHDSITISLMNYSALAKSELGKNKAAISLFESAIEAAETSEGPDSTSCLDFASNLAGCYRVDGLPAKAQALLESTIEKQTRLHGADHPETLMSQGRLGSHYHGLSKYAEAKEILERVIEKMRQVNGPNHVSTLSARNALAFVLTEHSAVKEAEAELTEVIDLLSKFYGPENGTTLDAKANLAYCLMMQSRDEEAIQVLSPVLESAKRQFGEDYSLVAICLGRLGSAHRATAQFAKAEELLTECLKIETRKFGADSTRTLSVMGMLADLYYNQGNYEKACAENERLLPKLRVVYGKNDAAVVVRANNLAYLYLSLNELEKAETMFQEVIEGATRLLGPGHFVTLAGIGGLASVRKQQGDYGTAVTMFEKALAEMRKAVGDKHDRTVDAMSSLASAYIMIGRLDEAELYLQDAIAIGSDTQGAEHPDTLRSKYRLAEVHRIRGNYDEAESLLVRVLDGYKSVHGESHQYTATMIAALGKLNLQNGQFKRAEPLLEQALQLRRELLGEEHLYTLDSKDDVAELLIKLGHYSRAEELLSDCLEIREKRNPERWQTFWTTALLAKSLSQQSQFEEAEGLMLKGYAGLKQKMDSIPYGDRRVLRTAIENTVELYERWERADEASKWQDELRKFDKEQPEENGHEK